jgi:hypothetical protein
MRHAWERSVYKVCVRKPERMSSLGRPRRRWEDIQINLNGIGWDGVNWIQLAPIGTRGGLL